jgi:hypothetical protein
MFGSNQGKHSAWVCWADGGTFRHRGYKTAGGGVGFGGTFRLGMFTWWRT